MPTSNTSQSDHYRSCQLKNSKLFVTKPRIEKIFHLDFLKCKIGVVNKNRYLTCLPANDLIIDLLDNKIMVNYFSHKDWRYKKVGLRLWSVTVKNITTQHLQVYNQTLLSPSGNLGKSFWNVSSGARINLTFAFLRIISLILSNSWKDKF